MTVLFRLVGGVIDNAFQMASTWGFLSICKEPQCSRCWVLRIPVLPHLFERNGGTRSRKPWRRGCRSYQVGNRSFLQKDIPLLALWYLCSIKGLFSCYSREVLLLRYFLLPHLYTLFAMHAMTGSTVARPVWHEFPQEKNTLGLDTQFLLGSGLMVCPILKEALTSRECYFPEGIWYEGYELRSRPGERIINCIPSSRLLAG